MEKKVNQRVVITKKMLRDSLLHLLESESIYKISIRALCEHAGINRSTFYKNYGSQYDLLAEMEDEFLNRIRESIGKHEANQPGTSMAGLVEALTYAEENILLCRLLINNNIDPEFPKRLLYLPQIQRQLENLLGSVYDEGKIEYLSAFVMQGCYSVVQKWINKENRESVHELAELIAVTLEKIMRVP